MRCPIKRVLTQAFLMRYALRRSIPCFQTHQQNGDGRRRDAEIREALTDRGRFVIVKFGDHFVRKTGYGGNPASLVAGCSRYAAAFRSHLQRAI